MAWAESDGAPTFDGKRLPYVIADVERQKEHHAAGTIIPVLEQTEDGYVAYPIGLKGVVVGEGETYEAALADVKSAIAFHIETFAVVVSLAEIRRIWLMAVAGGQAPQTPRFRIQQLSNQEPEPTGATGRKPKR